MSPYFDYPSLPEGSVALVDGQRVSVTSGGRSFVADFPSVTTEQLGLFFSSLQLGVDRGYAIKNYQDIVVASVLATLDKFGLLIERGATAGTALTGKQLIARLEQEQHARAEESDALPLWDILRSGDAPERLLTGLAKEYFFLTSAAYDAITPAIARLHGEQRAVMLEFVLGEYRHDNLMLRSLKACGFTDEDVRAALPHPYTRGLTDQLRYWAETDPLTMMCALFMFEGTAESGQAYIDLLQRNRLPAGYIEGVVEHDRANTEGNHGAISREFMRYQSSVSSEDAERVSMRLADLHKLLSRRNIEVTRTYCGEPMAA